MGQLKLRPDAGGAVGRYPAGVLGDPKPIAQRFAHSADLRPAPSRRSELPLASPHSATGPAGELLAFRTRMLLVGLITAAVVPSLILVAVALGLIAMPGSEQAGAVATRQGAAPSAVRNAPALAVWIGFTVGKAGRRPGGDYSRRSLSKDSGTYVLPRALEIVFSFCRVQSRRIPSPHSPSP